MFLGCESICLCIIYVLIKTFSFREFYAESTLIPPPLGSLCLVLITILCVCSVDIISICAAGAAGLDHSWRRASGFEGELETAKFNPATWGSLANRNVRVPHRKGWKLLWYFHNVSIRWLIVLAILPVMQSVGRCFVAVINTIIECKHCVRRIWHFVNTYQLRPETTVQAWTLIGGDLVMWANTELWLARRWVQSSWHWRCIW